MDVQLLVGWNLRRLRLTREISQDELALLANVERAYVGHLERGAQNPKVLTLEKRAKALECEVMELVRILPEDAAPLKPMNGGRRKAVR